MAKSKLVKANEKIAKKVTAGYKTIEEGCVGGFSKLSDRFVELYLTREGETVEDAKARLAEEQRVREAAGKEAREARKAARGKEGAGACAKSVLPVGTPSNIQEECYTLN